MRPDPHPAHLVVDVGTTSTKLALAAGDELRRIGSFPTGDDWEDRFGAAIAGRLAPGSVQSISVASSTPDLAERLSTWWASQFGPPPLVRGLDPATAPLDIAYRPPAALGADRIANAVAAVDRWGAPVIVADVGTAITCDLVSGDGRFAGGAIAPGPHTAYLSLVERVPHLGLARGLPADGELPRVPTSTYDAVRVGVLRGAAAVVDSLAADYRAEVGAAPVVVTGGLGPAVARHCDTVAAVDPDLTLRGILLTCWAGRTAGCRPGVPRR